MSTKESSTNKKVSYPVYEMTDKGILVLPVDVINQIMYLHARIGKTEWSGILLYDVVSGNPSKPSEFLLKAKHVFLMDIGSAAFTEYETDGDIVDIYDNIEGAMDMKIGHVHSHHDMSAFFSGTDMDELMLNVDKHNYYVSLIVNFSGNYVAKVAFLSERKVISQMHYTDDHGQLKKFKEEVTEKTMIVVNMKIQLEYNNDFFYNRIDIVKKKIEDAKKAKEVKTNEGKKWKGRESGFQQSFYGFDQEFAMAMGESFSKHLDPKKLNDREVESLTKNLLTVTGDLSETRSVYTILFQIAEANPEELNFYYDFFEENFESILSTFFDNNVLAEDEMKIVIKEVIMSINRYRAIKKLKEIVIRITDILQLYSDTYATTTIDTEAEEINKAIENERKN